MNKINFTRRLNYEFKSFLDHLSYHRWYYIILSLIALTAILTGVITVIKVSSDVSDSTITDIALMEFIKGDRGTFSFIFNRFLVYLLSLVVVFISTINVYLFGINIFAIISNCYFIGVNCTCLIIVYGISGTFNVLFIVLPCALIYLILSICFSCIMMKKCVIARKFGKAASHHSNEISLLKCLIILILVGFLVCLCEGVLLSIFVKRFILIL